jgi:hypothetical protein
VIRPPLVGLADAGLTKSQLNSRFECKTLTSLSAAAGMKYRQAVETQCLVCSESAFGFFSISRDALGLMMHFCYSEELITFAIHTRLSFLKIRNAYESVCNETFDEAHGPRLARQYRLKSSCQAKERYGVSVPLSAQYCLHNALFYVGSRCPFSTCGL